ncbi:MAG: Ig-like domain-containing protein [Bacteroidetes bacterium]|nr:Ig-like domain-containing protein [Bacteroidota bacterium]
MNKVPALRKRPFSMIFPWIATLFMAGCAGQVQPPGGPPDSIPPAIIRTVPDTNALHVSTQFIELEFSEYVDRRSVEEAIFISPHVGTLEFDWGSTDVRINFSDTLRRNTTYVVTVGTDVVDLRAQNRMAQGFTLAFSTGDSLDPGEIRGKVVDDEPGGVLIFAYNLRGVDADTLNPTHLRPDYVMQTGADGGFRIRNIVLSTYRVIAVRDEYRDFVYDREIDAYGVTQQDVELTPDAPRAAGLWFRLAKEDTTSPFLSSVTASDQYHLLLRFSEALDTLTIGNAAVAVTDTLSVHSVRVGALYPEMANTALLGAELLDPLDSSATYRLRVLGVRDRAGNPVDSAQGVADFPGTGIPDTTRPQLRVRGVADSSQGIPLTTPFQIDFGKPVSLGPAMNAIRMLDSTGKVVPATAIVRTPAELLFAPRDPLQPYAWYTILVELDSLVDSRGRGYRDSTVRISFRTLDLRSTGTIEGEVEDPAGKGPVVITARSVDLVPPRSVSVVLKQGKAFLVRDLFEGRYSIQAYRDEDGNGQYSPGLPHPFHPSERFVVYPDTVKVRARWSIEGVLLKFP